VRDDAQAVASRDLEVFERGVTAFGSTQLVAAAAAFERGDSAAGSSLLDSARAVFGMSANALAGDDEVRHVRSMKGKSGDELKKDARGLERKMLSNFGNENSGY